MKKVLCVVLSLCLMVGLCACSSTPIKVKKFRSEEEMQAYVQGVWGNFTDLYFIDGDQLYRDYIFLEDRVSSYSDSLADVVREQGAESVPKLVVKDHLSQVEKDWFSFGRTLQFNYKQGTITYIEDGIEQLLYVGENVIFLDVLDAEINKMSDTPSYACDELIGPFEEVHNNFKPTTSMYCLTASKFAEVMRSRHSIAEITISGGDVRVYEYPLEINYNISKGFLTVSDRSQNISLSALASDALAVLGDAPNLPTNTELVDYYHANKVTNTEIHTVGSYSYTAYLTTATMELDDVRITVESYSTSKDGFTIIYVRFSDEH